MIAYIKGPITLKTPAYVVIETGGIGYKIHISLTTYAKLEKAENIKLITYFSVKEDSQTLYGFYEQAERDLFVHLISVSGIGPNTARILLSSLTPEEVRTAIIQEDVNTIKSAKGIGPKTAKRMIVELKDKMMKDGGQASVIIGSGSNTIKHEALSALVALGFSKQIATKAIQNAMTKNPELSNVETLIKGALKNLS